MLVPSDIPSTTLEKQTSSQQGSLTSVDTSNKRTPHIADHQPGNIESGQDEELPDGGTIQVSPLFTLNAGFDNRGVHGTLSILQSNVPTDAKLLQAFGPGYSNLVDQDRRLVFLASPSELLVIQDNNRDSDGAHYQGIAAYPRQAGAVLSCF